MHFKGIRWSFSTQSKVSILGVIDIKRPVLTTQRSAKRCGSLERPWHPLVQTPNHSKTRTLGCPKTYSHKIICELFSGCLFFQVFGSLFSPFGLPNKLNSRTSSLMPVGGPQNIHFLGHDEHQSTAQSFANTLFPNEQT